MAFSRDLLLLFAVRSVLVASLKTKGLTEKTWPSEDLFQLDEDKRLRNQMALIRTGAGTAKGPDNTYKKGAHSHFPNTNWCSASVISNLGGLGPDTSAPPELRYAGIKDVMNLEKVESLDIVVTALSSYRTQNPAMNGFNNGGKNSDNGCFGIINLEDTNGGESLDLEFKFVETGTERPVHVGHWEFMLYDIDMGANNTAIESLTVYNDIDKYFKSPYAEFSEVGTLDENDPQSHITFTATSVGDGADNPTDPDNLTPEQINKTFIGIYTHVQKFKLTFAVTEGKGGRNFMFAGSSTTEDEPECPAGDCIIWGDPHVLTFDAHREFTMLHPEPRAFFQMRSNQRSDVVNVLEEGQFWLVKSDDVHIQGRYNKRPHQNTTVLGGLAIGGPFLKGNTFIVRPLVGKITWNGEEVLSDVGSEFSNDLIDAKYKAGVKNVKDGSKGNGLEVNLPEDVKLVVNRLTRGLAVKISMCAREWQDGQCGNFNGVSKDDRQNVLMERVHPLRPKEALPWREHLNRDAVVTRT